MCSGVTPEVNIHLPGKIEESGENKYHKYDKTQPAVGFAYTQAKYTEACGDLVTTLFDTRNGVIQLLCIFRHNG